MSLTDSFKNKTFGNAEPQQLRDYTGGQEGTNLLYEGYAAPGVSQDTAGWVIVKHSYGPTGADTQTQPKYGLVWTLRSIYSYNSP